MKYVKQFLIIAAIAFVGEILNYLIPLPIPGSIYGMMILFIGLTTGLIPLASVKETGKFLVEIMPIMFIPAAVGLMESWNVMKSIFLPIAVVVVVSTIVVMAATGLSSQTIIRAGQTSGSRDQAVGSELSPRIDGTENGGEYRD